MTTTLQVLVVLTASLALTISLSRVLWLFSVRSKARRVLISHAKVLVRLKSDDPVKAEKAMSELRDLIQNDSGIRSKFSSKEKRTLKRVLSDRQGARFLAY